ncbi:protein FAR1-RELATED SEQUENCE 5-like [Panicum miliaceum]|uniref:Protein FAR1-RELATED SEQUENCE 5-like n=1 Tax=Panicum miliaceum TaxID=4540 RepID=A0A3L6PB32_PANMI|nr:protein FAR1-RELATED SEQUENCE 5-like [Panicum miliaceum]
MALRGVSLPAAWNYGAVERAFRDASERKGRFMFEPSVGKIFESVQEVFEYYNLYSWEVGFGVRLGWSRENKAGKRTMQDIVAATLRFGVPLEASAAHLYTRNIFKRFSDEMFLAGSFNCVHGDSPGSYVVSKINPSQNEANFSVFRVLASADGEKFSCDCMMFEHLGLPCRHVIKVLSIFVALHLLWVSSYGPRLTVKLEKKKVLIHTGATEVPAALVMKRWTVDARGHDENSPEPTSTLDDPDAGALHAVLYTSCMELLALGRTSRQAFEVALRFITEPKKL